MIAAPAGWEWVLAGFVLFRLFDVLKPWPISWFDRRIHGGLASCWTISSPACLPWPACNCLPTGEGRRLPNARLVVFLHSLSLAKRSDMGGTQALNTSCEPFCMQSSRLAVPAGLWPRLILLHCPYLALPIFPYSRYAAVKNHFHKYSLLIRSWSA